tara:strand:- start:4829 stop:6283 length:1455 start_codon:yes stop_codon:yes gene_type:complete
MVLPVLGLLGLGAAGLFGSAGKAIAGGAGEQMSDLYAQDRAEKLDYLKRKRLMEESAKLSRQAKIGEDKEAEKKERAKAEKNAEVLFTRLTQEGRYTPKNAVAIMAGGTGAVNEALSFSKGLKADDDGILPDVNTYYTTFVKGTEISQLPEERQQDFKTQFSTRTRSEWIQKAADILDPNANFTQEYMVQRTKGQVDKTDEGFIKSNAEIMAQMTQIEAEALNNKKTGPLFKKMFGRNEGLHNIDLTFNDQGEPADANTMEVFRLINNVRNTAIKNQGTSKKNIPIKDKTMNAGQFRSVNNHIAIAINQNEGVGSLTDTIRYGEAMLIPTFAPTRNAEEHFNSFVASEQALALINNTYKVGTPEAPEFTQYIDFRAIVDGLKLRSAAKRKDYLLEVANNHRNKGQAFHDTELEKRYVPQADYMQGYADYSNQNFQGLDYLDLSNEQKIKYLNSKNYSQGTVIFDNQNVPIILQGKSKYFFISRD